MWLDDLRDPARYGHVGWTWAKTADQAMDAFRTGTVTEASLDHDLTVAATLGRWEGEITGYEVLLWLEQNPRLWPSGGIAVHSINPFGRARMQPIIDRLTSAPRPAG